MLIFKNTETVAKSSTLPETHLVYRQKAYQKALERINQRLQHLNQNLDSPDAKLAQSKYKNDLIMFQSLAEMALTNVTEGRLFHAEPALIGIRDIYSSKTAIRQYTFPILQDLEVLYKSQKDILSISSTTN